MDPLSAALGIGGLAWNIGSGLLGYGAQSDALDQQREMFNEQMEFAKYQYEDQKKFNSAKNQVQRLRAGGLNPALVFGKDAGMASSVAQPSAPQLHAPQLPQMSLNGIADIAKGIITNKPAAEKDSADAKLKDTQAGFTALQKSFEEKFGSALRSSQVSKNYNEALYHYQMAMLAAEKQDTEKTIQQLNKAQEFLNYAMGGFHHEKMRQIQIENEVWRDFMLERIRSLKSQSRLNDFLATESDTRATGNILNNGIVANAYDDIIQGTRDLNLNYGKQGRILDAQFDEARGHAMIALENGNHATALFWKDFCKDIAYEALGFFGAIMDYKRWTSYKSLTDTEKRRVDSQINQMKFEQDLERGTYHQSDTYKYKDSYGRVHSVTNSGRRSRTNPY